MTWMEETPKRLTENECELKFHINPNLRPDKQKRRNQKFITWLMDAHPMAFLDYEILEEGMLYRIQLEDNLENWIMNKLDELKYLHNFDYNIYVNYSPTCDGWLWTHEGK